MPHSSTQTRLSGAIKARRAKNSWRLTSFLSRYKNVFFFAWSCISSTHDKYHWGWRQTQTQAHKDNHHRPSQPLDVRPLLLFSTPVFDLTVASLTSLFELEDVANYKRSGAQSWKRHSLLFSHFTRTRSLTWRLWLLERSPVKYLFSSFFLGVAKEGCYWTSSSPYVLTSANVHYCSLRQWYFIELRGSPLLAVSHTIRTLWVPQNLRLSLIFIFYNDFHVFRVVASRGHRQATKQLNLLSAPRFEGHDEATGRPQLENLLVIWELYWSF